MIQDIYPHTFDNTFVPEMVMKAEDYIFLFNENSLLLKQVGAKVEIPKKSDFNAIEGNSTYLFSLNGQSCFWVDNSSCVFNEQNFSFYEIKFLHTIAEREVDFLSGVALHLKNWYEQHSYCGKCGSTTVAKGDERALVCTSCSHTVFPTISPAIIVAIICGEHILLARGVLFPEGMFSLVAGYVDVGETIEETIVREVHEEVGINIGEVAYYKSQPWSFSGSEMLAFITQVDEMQDLQIDNKEIAEAGWFHRDCLPNFPPDRSIAGEIIEKFKRGTL